MLGMTIDDSEYNPEKSYGVSRYGDDENDTSANPYYLGGFDGGRYACFDDINMTGVNSIDISYARATNYGGKVAVYLDSAEFNEFGSESAEIGINLGEFSTTSTGSWSDFQPLSFRLEQPIEGTHTLCFRAILGGGVMNLDEFTLSAAEQGVNEGKTQYEFSAPDVNAPMVAPVTTEENNVLYGGEPKSLAGISLFWSNHSYGGAAFYNEDAIAYMKNNWGVNLLRVPLGVDEDGHPGGGQPGGFFADPWGQRALVFKAVNAAIENGMYVIIDWHSHHAEDYTEEAIEFFAEMSRLYGSYENVMFEIYNEPDDKPNFTNWATIKSYAEQVIPAIRDNTDNLIIVGTPNWSQQVDQAAQNPITGVDNIAYTLHFYAASHQQELRNIAASAAQTIPLFVTEWGSMDALGSGNINLNETQQWMTFLQERNISHTAWALTNNEYVNQYYTPSGEHKASILAPSSDHQGLNWTLTDHGQLVIDIISDWPQN